ncbi:MAG: DUF3667 domain-containing protein [Betaproteobacteria bacterium]|nr:MAG: DUF3667 domain-containing protein [Betaproteobacteria bacterium]
MVRLLATRPGLLTREYFEGRKVRYVSPLRASRCSARRAPSCRCTSCLMRSGSSPKARNDNVKADSTCT